MDDERYQVSIPANVKIRTELINGIGIKELITTAIAGTISGVNLSSNPIFPISCKKPSAVT